MAASWAGLRWRWRRRLRRLGRVWGSRLGRVDWRAVTLILLLVLAGCRAGDGPNGDRTPQPAHTTVVTCPPACPRTAPVVNPTLHAAPATLPAGTHPPVPRNATGYCEDGLTYTTKHNRADKQAQCAAVGSHLAGDS